jgi:hypothetical protein
LINTRNDDRNRQLRTMALDAVEAVNTAGITPVFLKGMAVWASCHPADAHSPRMMSDVDLLVRPEEGEPALEALLASGFRVLRRHPVESPHVIAELWREGDGGALDLHLRPPGPSGLTQAFDLLAHTEEALWPGRVRTPIAVYQIYLTCLHDMLHDGGFWRGGFDIRHLCDVADLAKDLNPADWDLLAGLLPAGLVRNAVCSQLVAAHHIVGAQISGELLRRIVPRIHYQRHYAQYAYPSLHFPLALMGIGLEARNLGEYQPTGKGGVREGKGAPSRLADRFARVYRLARAEKIQPHPNKL